MHEDGILYAIAKLIFADEILLIEKKEDITNVINEIDDKIDFYALSNIVINLNNFVISNKKKRMMLNTIGIILILIMLLIVLTYVLCLN